MQKLQTPSYQKLSQQAKTAIARLKQLEKHTGWQKTGDKPCQIFKMGIDNLMASKGIAIVNYPIEKVLAFLDVIGNLSKLDETCIQENLVQEIKDIQIVYLRFKAPWPVSHRDFITVSSTFRQSANKFYIGTQTCDYAYPLVEGVVRAQCIIGGYVLEKVDQKRTSVTYMSNADIKGLIPTLLKNQLSKKQGLIAGRVEQAMSK